MYPDAVAGQLSAHCSDHVIIAAGSVIRNNLKGITRIIHILPECSNYRGLEWADETSGCQPGCLANHLGDNNPRVAYRV